MSDDMSEDRDMPDSASKRNSGGGVRRVLSIAGSDSSGGAGIQADLKTIAAHLMYGETVICAVTAQNTCGVRGVGLISPELVRSQIDAVFEDIAPDATKVGMLGSAENVRAVANGLQAHAAKHVVVDPVLVATSGDALAAQGTTDVLKRELLGCAEVVTPNAFEASELSGIVVERCETERKTVARMIEAARAIRSHAPGAILVKGGHLARETSSDVLLLRDGRAYVLTSPAIPTKNSHGTGCTLSSAIACGLAAGMSVLEAVAAAKDYLVGCLAAGLDLGKGNGPVDHLCCLRIDSSNFNQRTCEIMEWSE
jgi:hydroxymethylpyrimidine/phosphomethylpyrimidine kinase